MARKFIFALAVLAFACNSKQTQETANEPIAVEKPTFASGFAIEKYESYQRLLVFQAQDTLTAILYPKNAQRPAAKADCYIAVPIQKAVVLSATHIGLLEALGKASSVVGVSYPDYIYSEAIHQRLAAGQAQDVGMEGGLNMEAIMALQPDVVIATAMPQGTAHAKLKEAGIPVVLNAEWLEPNVLGRAEWIKMMGALTQQGAMADSIFEHSRKEYERLKAVAQQATNRPKAISGLPYKGVWSVAGGNSYVARLIEDAGGTWPWAHEMKQASMQLDFEAVYPVALEAPYWISVGTSNNIAELKGMDARFADFPSVKLGQAYNYNKRLRSNGMGNDYWESGVANPHLILADLIAMMHPELLPGHELYYYRKLGDKP